MAFSDRDEERAACVVPAESPRVHSTHAARRAPADASLDAVYRGLGWMDLVAHIRTAGGVGGPVFLMAGTCSISRVGRGSALTKL